MKKVLRTFVSIVAVDQPKKIGNALKLQML
jgi:hypothetical protein